MADLKDFLSSLATDPSKLGEFIRDPEAVAKKAELSDDDLAALKSGLPALIHARLAGVSLEDAFNVTLRPPVSPNQFVFPVQLQQPLQISQFPPQFVFQQLPPQFIFQLPPQFQQLPPQFIFQLPPQFQQLPPQFQQLPPQFIFQLPPQFQQLPPQFIFQQLPPQFLQQLPPQFIFQQPGPQGFQWR